MRNKEFIRAFKLPLAALILSLWPASLWADDFSNALQATLQNHPAIKGKQAEVHAQEFQLDTAGAKRWPTLSGEATNVTDGYERVIVRADQALWTFGKIDTGIELAKSGIVTETLALLQLQRQLIEKTALAYSKAEGLHRQLKVSDNDINEQKELVEHITRRFNGQLASEADVTLGESRLILAQSRHQRLKGELVKALTELTSLTMTDMAVGQPVPGHLLELPEAAELLQIVLEQSPDVRYKLSVVNDARLRIDSERANAMPDLKLRAEHDFLDKPVNRGGQSRIGLVVSGSLEGLGMVAFGKTGAARARYQASLEDVEVTKLELQRRVDALLSDKRVFSGLINAQQNAVAAVEKTLTSYFRLYKSGHKSWLDVLNIQRELTEQRLQLEQLKTDDQQARLQLSTLMGGLDQVVSITCCSE